MPKYEYMVIEMSFKNAAEETRTLNAYGNDGWDLIGITAENMMGSTNTHLLFFKRKII